MTPTHNTHELAQPIPSPVQRKRLVQLCHWLTSDREAAEDLAQETLIIAWQQVALLRDPACYDHWLDGIARNRCRQWLRSQRRQRARQSEFVSIETKELPLQDLSEEAAFDIEIELDRQQLAYLLDQALAQLPALTRSVLVERFIHESPQAEIARQLGLSEGAVEQRVQRGKLTLRRVLTTDLKSDALALGLIKGDDGWQETRLWCPCCGKQKLSALVLSPTEGSMGMHCSACKANFGSNTPGLFDGIHGYRTMLTRYAQWCYPYFQQGLAQGSVDCPKCGHNNPIHRSPTADMPTYFAGLPPDTPELQGFWVHCVNCNQWSYQSDLPALAFFVPAVQQFWRDHRRIKVLPERTVEINNRPAFLITYQAVTSEAQIDLLFDPATLLLHSQR